MVNFKEWLTFMSVQSTPLTVVSLLLGFATVEGTVVTYDILPIILIGSLGHWAFYSMNDVVDKEYDKSQGRFSKPLVNGSINRANAIAAPILLYSLSLVAAIHFFPIVAVVSYIIASYAGYIYNRRSKNMKYSGLLLSVWGLSIVFTGSIYAGGITPYTLVIMSALSVHMFWMTLEGDLKDIDSEERSIPEALGCNIKGLGPYDSLHITAAFFGVSMALVLLEFLFLLILPIAGGISSDSVIPAYIAFFTGSAIVIQSFEVTNNQEYNKTKIKKKIALQEVLTVVAFLSVSIIYMGVASIVLLLLGSVIFGLSIQTILYGHPLRFP